jgi:Mrp family chromosome partitioning ATPase
MAMAQLAAVADVVVYDAPPVATVADALLLSPHVDGVLHVVQAGGPRRDVVQRARDALRRAGAPLLGTVLNQVRASDLGYYRYCYDGDYHGRNGQDSDDSAEGAWWRRTLVQAAEWAEGRLSKEEGDAGA